MGNQNIMSMAKTGIRKKQNIKIAGIMIPCTKERETHKTLTEKLTKWPPRVVLADRQIRNGNLIWCFTDLNTTENVDCQLSLWALKRLLIKLYYPVLLIADTCRHPITQNLMDNNIIAHSLFSFSVSRDLFKPISWGIHFVCCMQWCGRCKV